jgi:hypothetical protein
MSKSKIKTMLVVLFDIQGIIMTQSVPPGQTVNQMYYIELLTKFRGKIRRKRPELWKNGWILLQKICVEERPSFPEARKRYFNLQPKQMKVTYAQAAASLPSTSEMSPQTSNATPAPETDSSKVHPTNPGFNPNQWNYPNNHGLMNQKKCPHTNRALLVNTLTVWMARVRAPFLTQNYPMRT